MRTKTGITACLVVALAVLALSVSVSAEDTREIHLIFTADFEFDIDGKEVRFTYTGDDAQRVRWSFGDGFGSDDLNPVWEYERYGNYTVTLMAIGPTDEAFYRVQHINLESPVLDISADGVVVSGYSITATGFILAGIVGVVLWSIGWSPICDIIKFGKKKKRSFMSREGALRVYMASIGLGAFMLIAGVG
jgi:hypothetical protein